MREILFRGKRVDNGEWVEGDLIQLHDGRKFIVNNKFGACLDNKGNFINTEAPFVCEVIPETVGQFTGLTDKNGKKIFEGDIVSTKYRLGRGGYYVFEVYYNKNLCQFALTINSGSYTKNRQYDWLQLTSLKADKIEVIGNIHDNEELLEGGE